jgi:hypothetical protein
MKRPYCNTRPLACCEEAQNKALYAKPDIELPRKYKLLQAVVSVIFFGLVIVAIALSVVRTR